MVRYFVKLSYKGTKYFGWQIQPNQTSVQEVIQNVLSQLHKNNRIELVGCGRTDTGVHASEYYAHFDSEEVFDLSQLRYKMNVMLPDDISIHDIFEVKADLHARFSATSRTYEYRMHFFKDPFLSDTSLLFTKQLDLSKMNEACRLLKNYVDFECFSKVNTDVSNFNCTIFSAEFLNTENGIVFKISANRFLRNMVRAITGTMIDIGTGKITLKEFQSIIESKNRSNAGTSVPAHGLTLIGITYPFEGNIIRQS